MPLLKVNDMSDRNAKNFAKQDLRNFSFKGQDLNGANFMGAELRGCDFRESQLVGANFTGAKTGKSRRQDLILVAGALAFTFASAFAFVFAFAFAFTFAGAFAVTFAGAFAVAFGLRLRLGCSCGCGYVSSLPARRLGDGHSAKFVCLDDVFFRLWAVIFCD